MQLKIFRDRTIVEVNVTIGERSTKPSASTFPAEGSDPCDNHIQKVKALIGKQDAGEPYLQLSQMCKKPEVMQCVLPWIEKTAEIGDRRAQATLGVIYIGGYGVPLDQAESSKWFGKAAEGEAKLPRG